MSDKDKSILMKELEEECDCSIVDSEDVQVHHIGSSDCSPSYPLRVKLSKKFATSFDPYIESIHQINERGEGLPSFGVIKNRPRPRQQFKSSKCPPRLSLNKHEPSVNILMKLQDMTSKN